MDKKYYVYAWYCLDWGGTYFYVGKGTGNRYKQTSNRGKAFKSIVENWKCEPIIIEKGLTEEEAFIREREIKENMIFRQGFPIMDGEGHGKELKNMAVSIAKREKRKNDPNYHEGRPKKEVECILLDGENISQACRRLGIGRATWYRKSKI